MGEVRKSIVSLVSLPVFPWLLAGILLFSSAFIATGQRTEFDSLMYFEIPVENPITRPELGVGFGTFGFLGDVRNNFYQPVGGKLAVKLNASAYLDRNYMYKLNFSVMRGILAGYQINQERNLNFQTEITSFGVNLQYDFGHLIERSIALKPFISGGIETVQFNSKIDMRDGNGAAYPWIDNSSYLFTGVIVPRDYIYETDLQNSPLNTLGGYAKFSFALPLETGFDLALHPRLFMRFATSIHFSLSDKIDNVGPRQSTNSRTDWFQFSYIALHLDPFSESRVIRFTNLYSDLEADPDLLSDEDNDFVFDLYDLCPHTPPGVAVDSLGCPLDIDTDGVPDYLDREINSAPGAIVDNEGVTMTEEKLESSCYYGEAVRREEVMYYFLKPGRRAWTTAFTGQGIPVAFSEFDRNNDGSIAFDELLNAIDKYFDYQVEISSKDMFDLIDFFFNQ